MESSNFSIFALRDAEPTHLQKLELDENGEPLRKRQQHRKSRTGCRTCKQRKVKCDETRPSCLNCKKRGSECSLVNTASARGPIAQRSLVSGDTSHSSSPASSRTSRDTSQQCDLTVGTWKDDISDDILGLISPAAIPSNVILKRTPAERELIQHFERFTSKALALFPSTGQWDVISSALHHDYLMNAIMLLAASHINFYLPKNDPNRRPVLHYFANALSGLRVALAEKITAATLDAIVGCSVLLIHHSWSITDNELGDDFELAYCFRETVALFHGLKDCLITAQHVFSRCSWCTLFSYSPRIVLEEYVHAHKPSGEEFSTAIGHCLFCGLGTRALDNPSADNISSLQRLGLVIIAIRLAKPDIEGSGVSNDIYRYLFTWPMLCTKGFVQQVRENNPTSLCILLWYYAAILSVLSDRIWWMRERALFMYNTLVDKLVGCEACTQPPVALRSGVEWPKANIWPEEELPDSAMQVGGFM